MYTPPVKEVNFALHRVLDAGALSGTTRYADYSEDVGSAVLEEAGRFASEVLEPLNVVGDRIGAKLDDKGVTMPPGFREAYQQYIDNGWSQLAIESEIGGQGMPLVLATAVQDLWFSANTAFMLCPMLANGATEALRIAGSDELKARFLPQLVAGADTGTMNLTEPQAGSDLAAIRTRAVKHNDHYRLFGQKIFITYGDHDLTENIIHLVLARIDGAPAGVKGISLFVVPKLIRKDDGSLLQNDVRCVSLEHKLGIHASPTCVMSFGDKDGAIGHLVGEEHHGLEYMFIMMNNARLSVGVQGIGLSERALQQANSWAYSRMQGRVIGAPADKPLPIAHHPDVRRMLLTIRSGVDAMRLLALYAALQFDRAHSSSDTVQQSRTVQRAELLIPIVKAWSTERVNELVSLGVQIHGGMGYIEETGIAQTLRDARITAIYEGTTGIQANDLIGRKLLRDHGAAMHRLIDEARQETELMHPNLNVEAIQQSLRNLHEASEAILIQMSTTPATAYAVSVPYLMLCGYTLGGWLLARAAHIATHELANDGIDTEFMNAKIENFRFYSSHTLPLVTALTEIVRHGGQSVVNAETGIV